MRQALKMLWLSVAILALQSCASTRVSDAQPNQRAQAQDLDERGLWYEMDRAEKLFAQSPERVKDPEMENYLRALTCELAPDLCADLRVYLFQNPSFNAFMTPNGMMGVYTGLWLRCENRSQLAAVIGHEIGHYRKRHSLENWRHNKNLSGWMTGIGVIAGGTTAGALATLGLIANSASFSREQEREADQLGFTALQAQGYDTAAPAGLWAGAYDEERANPPGMLSAIFASHPATRARRDTLQTMASTLPRFSETALSRGKDAEFLRLTLKHRRGWLEDELSRRNYAQSEIMLKRLAGFGYDQAALQHALGQLYRKRSQPGDWDRARVAYEAAIAEAARQPNRNDPKPESYRDLGLVLKKLKREQDANQAFKRYLQLLPGASDKAMIEAMLNTSGAPQ